MADVWQETGDEGSQRATTGGAARARVARGRARVAAPPPRRIALHPRGAAGRRAAIRPADGTGRPGGYWNLAAPYPLASALFPRGSPEATGALRYMLRHGSRLLGLVRASAFALYGKTPRYPQSGTDQVYGINVARFLALNDRPDQLRALALRTARGRDDARHLRRRRSRVAGAGPRASTTARRTCRRTARRTPPSSKPCG